MMPAQRPTGWTIAYDPAPRPPSGPAWTIQTIPRFPTCPCRLTSYYRSPFRARACLKRFGGAQTAVTHPDVPQADPSL